MTPTSNDPSTRAPDRGSRLAVAVLGLGLLWTLALLYVRARELYFFSDDWVFLLLRDVRWPDLLEPYNGHWSTTLLLAMRGLLRIFGFGHYAPYAAIPVVAHLVGTVSLYVVLRRTGARAWPAALATLVVGMGVGSLAVGLLWIAVTGFIGAVGFATCGLALALAVQRAPLRYGLSWAAQLLALMCSAMAPVVLIWAGVVVLRVEGLRRALWTFVPPGAVFVVWLAAFSGDIADADFGSASLADRARFVGTGVRAAWDSVLAFPAAGVLMMATLLVAALLAPAPRNLRVAALSGLAAVLLLFVLLARTRAGLGVVEAASPRYTYAGLFLTIPALALALQAAADRVRRPAVLAGAGALIVGLAGLNGFSNISRVADNRVFVAPDLARTLQASVDLVDSGEPVLTTYISPTSPPLSTHRFDDPYLKERLPRGPLSRLARLRAALALQVVAQQDSLGLVPATGLQARGVTIGDPDAAGCRRLQIAERGARLDLPPTAAGTQIRLVPAESSVLRVSARQDDIASEPLAVPVEAGQPIVIGSVLQRATARVVLEPGAALLCEGEVDTRAAGRS